jgi:hypothetical protein
MRDLETYLYKRSRDLDKLRSRWLRGTLRLGAVTRRRPPVSLLPLTVRHFSRPRFCPLENFFYTLHTELGWRMRAPPSPWLL